MADVEVQHPPAGGFSYSKLVWTATTHRQPPNSGEKAEPMNVQQAKIPWERVKDFIVGEEAR